MTDETQEMIERMRAERTAKYAELIHDRQNTLAMRIELALPSIMTKLTEDERRALAEWVWTTMLTERADERTRTIRSMAGGEWSMNREM